MTEKIVKGTWVEITSIVLAPGERAPSIPDDTQQVPLELKAKGFLRQAAFLGVEAEIKTVAGRRLVGTITTVNPAYTHGFGAPITELAEIGEEVRTILREQGHDT